MFRQAIIFINIALAVFISLDVNAQKIKKEGLGFFNYLKPRLSSNLDQATHYYLDIELSNDELYRKKLIQEKLDINKFKKATVEDDYHFTIKLIESPFKFGRSERNTSQKKVSKNGVETTVNEYYYTGSLGYSYSLIVLDKTGNEIYRELIRGNIKARGRSSNSLSTAQKNYTYDKLAAKDKVVDNFIERASYLFNNQFTDTKQTISIRLPYVVEKKYTYPNFTKAFLLLTETYKTANDSYVLVSEQEKNLTDVIIFLDLVINEAELENKKAKVNAEVAAAAYFNQAISYFILCNYKAANHAFTKAQSLDNIMASLNNWVQLTAEFESIVNNRIKSQF